MDFMVSYALRALSFSSGEAGFGFEIKDSNLAASSPNNSGVSFIGVAIYQGNV